MPSCFCELTLTRPSYLSPPTGFHLDKDLRGRSLRIVASLPVPDIFKAVKFVVFILAHPDRDGRPDWTRGVRLVKVTSADTYVMSAPWAGGVPLLEEKLLDLDGGAVDDDTPPVYLYHRVFTGPGWASVLVMTGCWRQQRK